MNILDEIPLYFDLAFFTPLIFCGMKKDHDA
jgi:hypothetical protein